MFIFRRFISSTILHAKTEVLCDNIYFHNFLKYPWSWKASMNKDQRIVTVTCIFSIMSLSLDQCFLTSLALVPLSCHELILVHAIQKRNSTMSGRRKRCHWVPVGFSNQLVGSLAPEAAISYINHYILFIHSVYRQTHSFCSDYSPGLWNSSTQDWSIHFNRPDTHSLSKPRESNKFQTLTASIILVGQLTYTTSNFTLSHPAQSDLPI